MNDATPIYYRIPLDSEADELDRLMDWAMPSARAGALRAEPRSGSQGIRPLIAIAGER